MPYKVFVADDHAVVRVGLRQILKQESQFEWVGEADNGEAAIAGILNSDCDVAIVDIAMPGVDGFQVLRQVLAQRPQVRVLILTMHEEEHLAIQLLRDGAVGYMTKDEAPASLLSALRRIVAGGKFMSPAIAEKVAMVMTGFKEENPLQRLSSREFEVLRLLARGLTNQKIAEEIRVSASTVATYRRRIGEKLGLETVADLTRFALRHGLVE